MDTVDTVLFDFDGTVMDTNEVIIKSWRHTFKTLKNSNVKTETLIKTFGEPLEVTMKRFFPDVPAEKSIEVYRSFHRDNFEKMIKIFPGMKQMLRDVKNGGYKTGLVTSRLMKTTDRGLEAYDIKKYFDVLVTADETLKHKPDPEPINIALTRLSSKAVNTVMIGDTIFDILCARNAGVKSILVSWSLALRDHQDFGETPPDYIISNGKELFDIIH